MVTVGSGEKDLSRGEGPNIEEPLLKMSNEYVEKSWISIWKGPTKGTVKNMITLLKDKGCCD